VAVAAFKGGEALTRRLREIAQRIKSAEAVRVGFLEGATYPDGTSVGLIAAIQEFGASSQGIPPRPFFRTMIAAKKREWGPALAGELKASDYDAKKALGVLGEGIAGQLRQSIIDLISPPLAPATIARKGSDKPLVDTGHMLDSVDKEVV